MRWDYGIGKCGEWTYEGELKPETEVEETCLHVTAGCVCLYTAEGIPQNERWHFTE